jgi:hypothetical protein
MNLSRERMQQEMLKSKAYRDLDMANQRKAVAAFNQWYDTQMKLGAKNKSSAPASRSTTSSRSTPLRTPKVPYYNSRPFG